MSNEILNDLIILSIFYIYKPNPLSDTSLLHMLEFS